jgi:hypothetical protein
MIGLQKHTARIAYSVSVAVLAVLLGGALTTGCTSEQQKRDAAKAGVAQLLAEHSQLRQFLEVDFFGIHEDVLIATPDGFGYDAPQAVILSNGELNIPAGVSAEVRAALAQHKQQIVEVFKEFSCLTLSLTTEGTQTGLLDIRFDNIKIDGTYYAQFLRYPSPRDTDWESVFTDWYYWAPAYT